MKFSVSLRIVPSVDKGTYGSCCVPRRGAVCPGGVKRPWLCCDCSTWGPRHAIAGAPCHRVPRRGMNSFLSFTKSSCGTFGISARWHVTLSGDDLGTLRPPACRICRSSRPSREKIANPILSKVVALKRRHASLLKSQKSGGRRRAVCPGGVCAFVN